MDSFLLGKNPSLSVQLEFNVDHCSKISRARLQCNCDCACSVHDQNSKKPLSSPVTYYFELTPICPNQCVGCGNVFIDRQKPKEAKQPLTLPQWDVILEKISGTASLIKLTGGEPVLYRDFWGLLNILKGAGIHFSLLTSGRWGRRATVLDRLCSLSNFDGFLISLHGSTAEVHQAFTQSEGSFADAIAAIHSASQACFDVSVSAVLTKANLHDWKGLAQKSLELGAKHVLFGRYVGINRPELSLSESEYRQAIQTILDLQRQGLPVRFGNCIPQCFQPSTSVGCTAGETFCTVDPWGNVRPCNHSRIIAGNLLTQSLEDVWWSSQMESWRRAIHPDCHACAAFSQCHGGCRAMAFEAEGTDPLMKGPIAQFDPVPMPPKTIVLYAHAIPRIAYRVKAEKFGPVLIANGRTLEVSSEIINFLEKVSDRLSLLQIRRQFGDQALSYIGELHLHGFVELTIPAAISLAA